MAQVLVTGSSGFIGEHLVRALIRRGDTVRALVRNPARGASLERLGATYVLGDITKPDTLPAALDGVGVVYHLAGLVKALRRADLERVNVEGTRHVAEACAAAASAPVLLLASSLAAVGPAPRGEPLSEEAVPRPVSLYGQSKLRSEQQAAALAERVPTTIVRPPIVFGAGDANSVAIFRPIRNCGLHFKPTLLQRWFSLVHVEDLVAGMILAAERGTRLRPRPPGHHDATGIYFLCDEERVSYAELGRRIARALGQRPPWVLSVPWPVAWLVAAVNETAGRVRGRAEILSRDKIREARAGSWCCSSQRAQRELGFAVAANLDERLRQTVEGFRQAGWL